MFTDQALIALSRVLEGNKNVERKLDATIYSARIYHGSAIELQSGEFIHPFIDPVTLYFGKLPTESARLCSISPNCIAMHVMRTKPRNAKDPV